jgi:hypothetical protein
MKRTDIADTLPLVLLGLMTLVGGLGGGMHSLFGCRHAPWSDASARASAWSEWSRGEGAPSSQAPELRAHTPVGGSDLAGGCPVCNLLEQYHSLHPAAGVSLPAAQVVATVSSYSDAVPPQATPTGYLPRGPPRRAALLA